MSKRNTPSCPVDVECPANRYCRAAAIGPMRKDGVKGMTVRQRQMSALNKMRLINRARKGDGRPRAELYKAAEDKNRKLISVKNGKPGHILAYACYPKTEHQKDFAKKNKVFTKAFTQATKFECTAEKGYAKSWQRSKCISDFINNDPDVIELKLLKSKGI